MKIAQRSSILIWGCRVSDEDSFHSLSSLSVSWHTNEYFSFGDATDISGSWTQGYAWTC